MKLSFQEWQAALDDVWNPGRMAELGYKNYLAFYGTWEEAPDEASAKLAIAAFVRLLNPAFAHMRLKTRRDLHKHMLLQGKVVEPALWEDPMLSTDPHRVIEDRLKQGKNPVLLELLIMAHDTEAYLRPNLLRLLWVAQISDGTEKPYKEAMLKKSGEQGSMKYALDELRKWIRSKESRVLPKYERRALRELIQSFKSTAPDQINLDELRNWVAHRDFMLWKDEVVFHFHRAKGERKRLRIRIARAQVTEMRRQMLDLVSLLKSFEVMFRVHEASTAKRRRPVR